MKWPAFTSMAPAFLDDSLGSKKGVRAHLNHRRCKIKGAKWTWVWIILSARGFLIPRFQRPSSPKLTVGRRLNPEEEEEPRTKQAKLDGFLDRLAQNELEPETLHAKINSFFSTYNAAVLPKVAEPEDRVGQR